MPSVLAITRTRCANCDSVQTDIGAAQAMAYTETAQGRRSPIVRAFELLAWANDHRNAALLEADGSKRADMLRVAAYWEARAW